MNIDENLNIIVGPNDSGKSNLLNTIKAVVEGLPIGRIPDWLPDFRHWGSTDSPIRIEIDVELTSEREKQLLVSFFASAFSENIEGTLRHFDRPIIAAISECLAANMASEHLEPLLRGTLAVGVKDDGRLTTLFRGLPGGVPVWWEIQGVEDGPFLSNAKPDRKPTTTVFALWEGALKGSELDSLIELKQNGTGNPPPPDLRRALVDFPGRVAPALTDHFSYLPTHRRFFNLAGVRAQQGMTYDSQYLWKLLLEDTFVFTENVRAAPRMNVLARDLSTSNMEFATGSDLAVQLARLKNGGAEERDQYERIQSTFNQLSGKYFDVGIHRSDLRSTEDEERLDLTLTTRTPHGDKPLNRSGAGLTEMLYVSMAVSFKNRVVLLDEPASNLHPGVQRNLLHLLESRLPEQFFMTTHSANLIPTQITGNVVRLYSEGAETKPAKVTVSEAPSNYVEAINKEMRGSSDARALPFNTGVILVEGPTETGALPSWWREVNGVSLDSRNITLYDVGGKSGFGKWMWYLSQLTVPWVVLCDGDAIGDTNAPCEVFSQMKKAGVAGTVVIDTQDSFVSRVEKLSAQKVFTLATKSSEAFETTPSIAHMIASARISKGVKKTQQGHLIADNYPCPHDVAQILRHANTLLT
jgi:energy-coupling factor transporter ATP-binding protein EcfA2